MKVVVLPVESISPAEWNPNVMDETVKAQLRRSIERFGILVPLVVRSVGDGRYETIGGAHRLSVIQERGESTVPCVIVEVEDAEARLLSQGLNRIAGEDDLGLRAEVIRDMLKALPQKDILAILPDSAENLRALASIGETTIADQLEAWQRAQSARLRHLQFQLTDGQLSIVTEALALALTHHPVGGPDKNRKAQALLEICETYLSTVGGDR